MVAESLGFRNEVEADLSRLAEGALLLPDVRDDHERGDAEFVVSQPAKGLGGFTRQRERPVELLALFVDGRSAKLDARKLELGLRHLPKRAFRVVERVVRGRIVAERRERVPTLFPSVRDKVWRKASG